MARLAHIPLVVGAMVTFPVVFIILGLGIEVVGPFFAAMGGEAHFGGVTANEAVSMKAALVFVGLSLLSIPAYLGLRLYMGGRSGGARRRPTKGRRP